MGQAELTAACQPMLARAVAEKGVNPDMLVLGDVLSMNVSTREGKLMERQISRRSRGQPVCGLLYLQTAKRQGLVDLEDVPRRPVGHGFNPYLSAAVSTPMTPLDVFGGVMNLLFFVPFLFPLAPWLAKRPRGAWRVCFGAVSVLVLLFPAIFWWGCDWSNCGQGAVAIFILAPVWLLVAVITPFSTWAAARKLARTASDPPGGGLTGRR